MLKVTLQDDTIIIVNIQYISQKSVIFDGNNPLVEQNFNIKIELIELL
jgi:FKBP-type peptidyl-prolyl cis-trans isomerase 2